MNFNSKQSQKGIVLLAVLGVTVALTLLITAATTMMQRQLAIGEVAKQKFHQKAAVHKKSQELVYLIATQRITRAGVSKGVNQLGSNKVDGRFVSLFSGDEIRVDGFQYKETINGVSITYSIQAADGLIPVNMSDQLWLKMWLNSYGIDSFSVKKLSDNLADYADEDSWARPLGGEASSYEVTGYPTNFLLQKCSELHNVRFWDEVIFAYEIDISNCNITRNASINVNAMPSSLLKKIIPDKWQYLLQKRAENNWLVTKDDVIKQIPRFTLMSDDYVEVVSDGRFTVNVESTFTSSSINVDRGRERASPFTLRLN